MDLVSITRHLGSRLSAYDERPMVRTARLAGRQWTFGRLARRQVPPPPSPTVSIEDAADVILRCSWSPWSFSPETYSRESAFAHEMIRRGRDFAFADHAELLGGKSVIWFPTHDLVEPRLWDHSRQVREFASGLETQGNALFCSSAETAFWENKVHMHRKLEEIGAPTPLTRILGSDTWESTEFDFEPVLIKQEHSAGSAGIHYFATAQEAREFVAEYAFRPEESLIMQEVVEGATRDLRVTIVGDRAIDSATYWRIKADAAVRSPTWTTTATSNNSAVRHDDIPAAAVELSGRILAELGVRTAGVDLIWRHDDLSAGPLVLEFSPYYQPNPPKPARHDGLSYKEFKSSWTLADGYLASQHRVFREISASILDQGLF